MLEREKQLLARSKNGNSGGNKVVSLPSKFPASDPNWHYRVSFEMSTGLEEMWIDSETLNYLNSFRENIFVSQGFPISRVTI